jgi:transcriptional antiterminator RfaH
MRERIATENLERDGFTVYAPRIKQVLERGRLRILPLFPGYIFVRIGEFWSPIVNAIGVVRLLRQGEQPAKLEDEFVNALQQRERDGFVRLPKAPPRIAKGDTVRVLRGMFAGHLAVYDGMSPKERELVLLEFLGRKVRLELAPADLEVVARTKVAR